MKIHADHTPSESPFSFNESVVFLWARAIGDVQHASGMCPSLLLMPTINGIKNPGFGLLAWWLIEQLNQPMARVSNWMGASVLDIEQSVQHTIKSAPTDPFLNRAIDALLTKHQCTTRTTRLDPHSNHYKTGMAGIWMTLSLTNHPLNLWGPDVGTKMAGTWATAWWLYQNKCHSMEGVAKRMGRSTTEIRTMLNRLRELACENPAVWVWMETTTGTNPDGAKG